MAEKFLMPKLSPTMEEGQISRWVKNEGDTYEANETLAEVDTDKATMEMTALSAGTLLKILKGAGETAALGEPIAIIGKSGEDISALIKEISANGSGKSEAKTEAVEETKAPAEAPSESKAPAPSVPTAAPSSTPPASGNGRLIVSPIAARMAAENAIDLRSITGSGPGGRIIKRDIEAVMESGGQASGSTRKTVHTVHGCGSVSIYG